MILNVTMAQILGDRMEQSRGKQAVPGKCGRPIDAAELKCQAGGHCPIPHRLWQSPESRETFSMERGHKDLWFVWYVQA